MQITQKGESQPSRQPRLTGPTFRLPKSVKAAMTTITDPHARGHFKRMMIDAWVTQQRHAAELAKKKDKKADA